jgi:hypothetical protein
MRQWSEASKLSTCDCEAGVEKSSATVAWMTFRRPPKWSATAVALEMSAQILQTCTRYAHPDLEHYRAIVALQVLAGNVLASRRFKMSLITRTTMFRMSLTMRSRMSQKLPRMPLTTLKKQTVKQRSSCYRIRPSPRLASLFWQRSFSSYHSFIIFIPK